MPLSEQQRNHFRTFGFLIFRGLFSSEETARYSSEFNAGLDAPLGGQPHDGVKRHYTGLMDERTPFIASLAEDPRFADVAEELLDKPMLGIATDGNYYVGDTLWHPDIGSHAYEGIKFAIYCDPQDASNGALRVVPGSHLEPLYSRMARDPLAAFGVQPSEVPAFAFESRPGDVIAFDLALWHAAFGGGQHRRMGTVIFYEDPRTAEATTAVQTSMRGNHGLFARMGRPMYPAYWRAGEHPRRRRTVGRLAELGVLETPAPG
jgi:hypothetical protein